MLISVIANFYKSERFIPKLIQSVLGQSFQDWELICVNDCSPGNDAAVLERFALKDSRIRVINNEMNLGICKAKFRGIEEARGEYLCFIDGDDWLEPEALQRMAEPALQHDLDMVIMNHKKVLPVIGYSQKHRSNVDCWNEVIELNPQRGCGLARENFVKYIGNFFGKSIFGVPYWGKLIRKEVVLNSGFVPPENYIAEDFVFIMTIFPYLKRLMFVDYVGYNWRWGGITSGRKSTIWTNENNIYRSNEIYKDRLELMRQYGLQCYEQDLMREQCNNFLGYISPLTTKSADKPRVVSLLQDVLREDFYSDFCKLATEEHAALAKCLTGKDADGVYDICHQYYQERKTVIKVKECVHFLLYSPLFWR